MTTETLCPTADSLAGNSTCAPEAVTTIPADRQSDSNPGLDILLSPWSLVAGVGVYAVGRAIRKFIRTPSPKFSEDSNQNTLDRFTK